MATAYKIVLGPEDLGTFHQGGYNPECAAKVSEVLQDNLERFHICFSGLRHNHIVHCVFSIYGLGATPEEIQKVYDRESAYQRPRFPVDEDVVKQMADKEKFKIYLDQQPHYSNFLLFFQREIEAKGVKATVEEHIFADDDHANHLFVRLFSNIFHPYLHLGYAFEFNQPAIVAEGLAMACVHDPEADNFYSLFMEAEKLAGGPRSPGKKTIRQVFEDIRGNKILKAAIDGRNPVDRTKNIADNAPEEMIKVFAEYSISDDQFEERMEEMIDTVSLTIATKPQPIKEGEPYKIDFFMLHSVNTLVLMPALSKHKWISRENAIRLIEWAGRCHMLTYVAQTAPPITAAEVDKYFPKRAWNEVFDRAINHPSDDGHMQKCIRSLAFGEQVLGPKYSGSSNLIKPDTWLRFANLVIDMVRWEAKTSEQRWLLWFE